MCASITGRKKKDQHDANQAAAGLNPSYAGAYGAAPPVSVQSRATRCLYLRFLPLFTSVEIHVAKNYSPQSLPWAATSFCFRAPLSLR